MGVRRKRYNEALTGRQVRTILAEKLKKYKSMTDEDKHKAVENEIKRIDQKEGVYIFDVDGTIADIEHRVHYVQQRPRNWPQFWAEWEGDKPYPNIVKLFQSLVAGPNKVIIVSARQERERGYTEQQFKLWGVEGYHQLYLRPNEDNRKDSIFKKEVLEAIRAQGMEPIVIFDDRQDVVDMWRNEGLTCAQVRKYDW